MSNRFLTSPAPTIPASLPDPVRRALSRGELIDITTIGRTSGSPHRVELVFHSFDGRLYISGRPGPRDWQANMAANPRFTFHLKQSTVADLAAVARPITDPAERREVLTLVAQAWRMDPERLIPAAPLVEVTILGPAEAA
jgi:hypothetical protein